MKKEKTIYYKVVSNINGELKSLYYNWWKKYSVTYVPGKWAKPVIKNSKLMVFSDLEKARGEFSVYTNREIWTAEARHPTMVASPYIPLYPEDDWIERFWKDNSNFAKPSSHAYNPPYILSCDAVKLVDRIVYFDFNKRESVNV